MWTQINRTYGLFLIMIILNEFFPTHSYRKCCKKGAQMAKNGIHCIRREDMIYKRSNNYIQQEILDNNSSLYWLPTILYREGMTVHYGMPTCSEGDFLILSIKDTERFKLNSDETLEIFLENFPFHTQTFHNDSYCLDAIGGSMGSKVIKVCACKNVTCVNKCCPKDMQIYSEGDPPICINDSRPTRNAIIAHKPTAVKAVIYRYPLQMFCEDGLFVSVPYRGKKVNFERTKNKDKLFSKVENCVNVIKVNDREMFAVGSCTRSTVLQGIEYLTRPLSVIAALFLGLTLFTLFTLSELRANTHGRALTCHVFCLTMVNTLRAVSYFHEASQCICLRYAVSVYFFLVAAGFWVNVLSIDMADGFRRPIHERAGGVSQSWKRTTMFAVYAWGASAILTGMVVHGEFCHQCNLPKPTYQETRTCFSESEYLGRKGTLTYYYGPMGVVFLLNLFIYAYLAIRLHRLNKDAGINDEEVNDPEALNRRATVFFRLLLMMGIVEWLVEIIMWGLRGKYRSTEFLVQLHRFASQEDEQHSQTVFRIIASLLDVARAMSLAWLCCGRPRVRRRLGESVRRTLRRPLRLASAFSSSVNDDANEDADDASPRASKALEFLRESVRRLRRTFSRQVTPTSALSRSNSEEPTNTSAIHEEVEMKTMPVEDDTDVASANALYKL